MALDEPEFACAARDCATALLDLHVVEGRLRRASLGGLVGDSAAILEDHAMLATGLRAANVTGLTWEQVDLSRKLAWVHPDQAKARKAIAVPLNDTAMQVLRAQRGKHPLHVFSYEGEPIKKVSTAACRRVGRASGSRRARIRFQPVTAMSLSTCAGSSRCHAPKTESSVIGQSSKLKIQIVPPTEMILSGSHRRNDPV